MYIIHNDISEQEIRKQGIDMSQIWKDRMQYWWTAFYLPLYLMFYFIIENLNQENVTIISIDLDHKIPFLEVFIIPYMVWFPYIIFTFLVFFFRDKKEFVKFMLYLYLGMTLFIIVSFIFPNGLDIRPTYFERDNIFVDLVKLIYAADTATNVVPSIHVYDSVVAAVTTWQSKKAFPKKWQKYLSVFISFMIIISTVFTKQHSILDILSGFVTAWIGYKIVYGLKAHSGKFKNAVCELPLYNGIITKTDRNKNCEEEKWI